MSLTERVVRAENGGHHISHFFLASMDKMLHLAPTLTGEGKDTVPETSPI